MSHLRETNKKEAGVASFCPSYFAARTSNTKSETYCIRSERKRQLMPTKETGTCMYKVCRKSARSAAKENAVGTEGQVCDKPAPSVAKDKTMESRAAVDKQG